MKRKRKHDVPEKDDEVNLKKKRKIVSKELKLDLVKHFRNLNVSSNFVFTNLWVQKMICEEGGYRYTHWKKRPSFGLDDEDIVKKIFPKNEKCRKFEKHLKDNVERIRMTEVKELMNKYWDKVVLDKSVPKPKYKTEISSWIVSVVFEKISYLEKRNIETENFDKNERLFVAFGDIVLPEEIILKILEYSTKDKSFLDGVGLINSKFYLLCLRSWSTIRIRKENIHQIPIIVLYYAKNINISSEKFLVSEYNYVFKQIHNVCYLNILDGVINLFSRLEKSGIVLTNCISCSFGHSYVGFEGTKEVDFPLKNFPNITKLVFVLINFKSYSFLKKIKEIVIQSNYSIMSKNQILKEILKNLSISSIESFKCELEIPISLYKYFFTCLEKFEVLRKLEFRVNRKMISSENNFEKHIFSKLKKLQSISFKDLSVIISNWKKESILKFENNLVSNFDGLSKLLELKTIIIRNSDYNSGNTQGISLPFFEKLFQETMLLKKFDSVYLYGVSNFKTCLSDASRFLTEYFYKQEQQKINKKMEEVKILCKNYNFELKELKGIYNPDINKWPEEFIRFKKIKHK